MADSDDEYDRKRRDKFRGERNEYRDVSRRPPPNDDVRSRRDDWGGGGAGGDREWGGRNRGPPPRNIDYRLGGGHRLPHEFSPPNKRPRGEWDRYSHDSYSSGYGSQAGGGGGGGGGFEHPQHSYPNHPPQSAMHRLSSRETSDGSPQLLSFKVWLSTQDDSISDQDALAKYAEYKQEFKRQLLNEFFVQHREEEWFKLKYHPDESAQRKEEQLRNLKARSDLFVDFLKSGKFDNVSLDSVNSEKLIKLMDWYVVRLEGGTEEDAAKLLSDEPLLRPRIAPKQTEEDVVKEKEKVVKVKSDENGAADKESGESSGSESEAESGAEDGGSRKKKKVRAASTMDALEAELDSNSKSGDKDEAMEAEDGAGAGGANEAAKKRGKKRLRSGGSEVTSGASDDADSDDGEAKEDKEENNGGGDHENSGGSNGGVEGKAGIKKKPLLATPGTEKKKLIVMEEDDELPQLHRTASVFLRNLAPSITKSEVESMCKKYPGYLRTAIADPQPEKRWARRAWVTFKRNVNIKEICWNLNNVRLRDTELGVIVNRDLTRRVRTVNGITPHKTIVRNDIRLAAKLIQHLDSKWTLWDEDKQNDQRESYGVYSTNPVLKNITDFLIEEASAEEDELLGMSTGSDGELDGDQREERNNTIERDEDLIRVLDRLLFYLRFVHSVDYYNHAEYPYEDEMPNRLGIIHARGMPPTSKVNVGELTEYNRNFEQKIGAFIEPIVRLNDEECKVFGMKDEDTEVEKFISANTQELGKDKWLCPLSGKKFKGPEFVRKHILNKHAEKLEEVKKEVMFFNNYLRDPKRPQSPDMNAQPPPERNSNQQQNMPQRREPLIHEREFHPPPQYPPPYGGGYGMGPGGFGGFGGPPRQPPYQPYREYAPRGRPFRMGGRDHGRGIISYRDLDAPQEPDDF